MSIPDSYARDGQSHRHLTPWLPIPTLTPSVLFGLRMYPRVVSFELGTGCIIPQLGALAFVPRLQGSNQTND
jgi:hypothetical protein